MLKLQKFIKKRVLTHGQVSYQSYSSFLSMLFFTSQSYSCQSRTRISKKDSFGYQALLDLIQRENSLSHGFWKLDQLDMNMIFCTSSCQYF